MIPLAGATVGQYQSLNFSLSNVFSGGDCKTIQLIGCFHAWSLQANGLYDKQSGKENGYAYYKHRDHPADVKIFAYWGYFWAVYDRRYGYAAFGSITQPYPQDESLPWYLVSDACPQFRVECTCEFFSQ